MANCRVARVAFVINITKILNPVVECRRADVVRFGH